MSKNASIRVGVVTLAVSLIGLGVVWLVQNLLGYPILSHLTRWWPVLLISLGIEYLWRNHQYGPEVPVRWSIVSLILIFLISGGMATSTWGPSTHYLHLGDMMRRANPIQVQRSFQLEPISSFEGSAIRIENSSGSVLVRPSSDNQIKIKGTMSYPDYLGPDYQPGEVRVKPGDTLIITAEKAPRTDWFNVNYEIEMPSGLNLEIKSGTGRVQVNGLRGNLTVDSRLGEVELRDIRGKVAVENDSGNIQLQNIEGDTALRSNLGMIAVKDIKGALVAEANGGQINVRTEKPVVENWDLKTSVGSINVQIPEGSSVLLEAQTNLGSVTSSDKIAWQTKGNKKVFQLGDGTGILSMTANGGEINVDLI